jgi:hypothetical protein
VELIDHSRKLVHRDVTGDLCATVALCHLHNSKLRRHATSVRMQVGGVRGRVVPRGTSRLMIRSLIVAKNAFLVNADCQASMNMGVPILPILGAIWTNFDRPIWTDVGWPSKWVRFTRTGVIHCGVTNYASCSGVA